MLTLIELTIEPPQQHVRCNETRGKENEKFRFGHMLSLELEPPYQAHASSPIAFIRSEAMHGCALQIKAADQT